MDIDEIYGHIGELGPAQAKLLVLLSLPSSWAGLHVLITNFIGTDPGWTCAVTTTHSAGNCSSTAGGGANGGCMETGGLPVLVTDQEEKCRHYESGDCLPRFDTSEYTSIVSEWELICSRSSYPNLVQSAYFFGLMNGSWLFGALGGMCGRKKVLFLSLLGSTLTGLGYSLAGGFLMFAFFRFIFGALNQAQAVVGYSLLLEMVGSSKRSFVAMLSTTAYPAGICLLALLAYLVRDWRTLCVFNSLVGFGLLLMWRFIPESPRWLLVQGREDEAKAVLAKIARGNGRKMTDSRLKRPSTQPSESTVSVTELFRGRELRRRTLILLLAWFTNCMVYYGLSMSAGSLGGGRYLSVALSGLVDLPAHYIGYVLLNRKGRKWTHGGMLMLAGMCCGLWALEFWAACGELMTLTTALLGKCAVAASYSVIYLYTVELFPTEVRTLGMGVVSVAARLGGILSPIILLMAGVSLGLPMMVMGCLGLLAGLLSLYLPETLNQPLPETLAELR